MWCLFYPQMIHLRSSQGDSKEEVEKLKEQLEEMTVWKEKVHIIHRIRYGEHRLPAIFV